MVDSRGALAQDGRRAERLELRVPTTATQLPAVRAMAGDLAIRMDYDLDAVEDLRLAVDEACATLAQIADRRRAAHRDLRDHARRAAHRGLGAHGRGHRCAARRVRLGDAATLVRRGRRHRRAAQAEVPGGDGTAHAGGADRDGQVPARSAAGERRHQRPSNLSVAR